MALTAVKDTTTKTFNLPPGVDPLLTRPQAAQYLGVAPRSMANWASAGTGPAYVRIGPGGRSVRYRMSSLVEYVNASETVDPIEVA